MRALFPTAQCGPLTTKKLLLRWVPSQLVPDLFQQLAAIGLAAADPGSLADVTTCPGAETCKLAVTQSRGVAPLVSEHFAQRREQLDALGAAPVHVSGCPNGCGLHHVAAIGLQGGMRKLAGRALPQHFLYLGGDGSHFGKVAAKLPARRVPAAIERLVELYAKNHHEEEYAAAFFRRQEPAQLKALLADLVSLTEATASAADYVDLAETESFSPADSEGECAA